MKSNNEPNRIKPVTNSIPRVDTSRLFIPNIIRYHDEFSGKLRTIESKNANWQVLIDGRKAIVEWHKYQNDAQKILKSFVSWAFNKYDPSTLLGFLNVLQSKKTETEYWLTQLSHPASAKTIWENYGYNQLIEPLPFVLRAVAEFLCEMSLFGWTTDDINYVSGWKWFSPRKKSSVEHGAGYYLLDNEDEKILRYFDKISSAQNVDYVRLRSALALYFSYAFGLRPIQIASLTEEDVAIHFIGGAQIAHVTFYQAKQRSGKKEPIFRKIKREWCSIMVDYVQSSERHNEERSDAVHHRSLFNLTPYQVSDLICLTSELIIGRRVTPTLFRHVAAQRMADLGMSQLELAEFLGHSVIDTCLVYFENSATQSEVVNRALGLSPIFKKVEEISKHRFLEDEELNDLPEDQQIGGAAHGIILAGIGGCAIGQSLCQLSPAISCYTCPKFLPIHKASIHKAVAKDLGKVVSKFEQSGRSDHSNPAYTQLSTTMSNILSIIETIEKPNV